MECGRESRRKQGSHASCQIRLLLKSSTNSLWNQHKAPHNIFSCTTCGILISQQNLPFSQLTPIKPSRQVQVPLTWLQETPFIQVHVLAQLVPNMPGIHATEIHRKKVERVEFTTGMLNLSCICITDQYMKINSFKPLKDQHRQKHLHTKLQHMLCIL